MTTAAPTAPAAGWRHRAVAAHTRTLVLGLSLLAGAVTLVLVAALVSGIGGEEVGMLAVAAAVPLAAAVVAWRFGTWGRVAGMVLGLGAATLSFWLAFGLFEPASFVEFTSGVAWVLGFVLLLYGGIASLVSRADIRTEPARSEVLLDRGALGLVVLALIVSLPLWLTGRQTVDSAVAAGLPEVTAADFAFEDVTLTASEGTSLVVRNADPFFHTFTIDELGIDVELLPGSAQVVELPDTAGTWTYYCIPHSSDAGAGEDDMAATLTIE